MTVSPIGSTTTSYVGGTTSVSSTTPTGSTTATSSTTASTAVSSTTSSTTVNYSSATASTTCSTTVSYGGASTTAIISSTSASTTYSINSSTTCTLLYSSSTTPNHSGGGTMFRVTLGQGSSTTYSYVSSSTTSVSQVFETIASESNIADKKIKALKAAADATIEEMLLNSPYLKDAYYVVEDGKLKIKGVAGGTIDGIASWYKLENVAKNEKLTNLLIQMDNYAKLNELSKWMGNVGNVFEKGSVLTGSLSEIFDENNETLADKAGGVASEVIVAFAEDKASQFAMWIATKMLSAGAKGASAGTVAGPMGIIVGAAAGLLASLAVDYIANIEVEDKSIKEWIADYASEAADVVGNAIVDASTAVWDWTTATANDIMENVSTTTENVVNWAQDTIENAWNTIEDSTAETLDWITNSGAAFASWITSW